VVQRWRAHLLRMRTRAQLHAAMPGRSTRSLGDSDAMRRVLFVCSQNRLRSPTAEQVFSKWPGIEAASAGLDEDASVPLTPELLQWADTIFVMEKSHRNKLSRKFKQHLKSQRVICLNIPDEYGFMDPQLVQLLKAAVSKHLPSGG
jgi:predicted protein tyrosine phosphatase